MFEQGPPQPDPYLQLQHLTEERPTEKRATWKLVALGAFGFLLLGGVIDAISGTDETPEQAQQLAATIEESVDPADTEVSDPTTTTTEATTTSNPPTTAADPETRVAEVTCELITEFIEDNPDARVIQAIGFATALRDELANNGYDPSEIGQNVDSSCRNGYNNEVIMGYGGFGPLADAVDYTLDRGSCGPRGDLGGVLTMAGSGGAYSLELELEYVANGVVEHQSTEYLDIESGGNGVAFEFYLPGDIPAGGECEVALIAVKSQ